MQRVMLQTMPHVISQSQLDRDDTVSTSPPAAPSATPDVVYNPPPDTGLDIVHLDEHLIVLVKPAGLLSVPGRGEGREDCMVSRAQQRYADALVVHRLDMATSGLLVLARGMQMQGRLSQLFQYREVEKRYVAVVDGALAETSHVTSPSAWPQISFCSARISRMRSIFGCSDHSPSSCVPPSTMPADRGNM